MRNKNPQLVAQHCFAANFGSTFPVFHLAWSTRHVTKTFVAGRRNLLRKVYFEQQILTLLLVFHQTRNLSTQSKSTNQCTAFFQPTTNVFVFVVGQVDHVRFKTRNIEPKLATKQCCVTSWGLLYLVFCHLNLSQNNLHSPCILGKRGTWLSACHWLNKPENEPLTVQGRYQNVENNERSHEMRTEWCSIWTQKWGLKPLKSLRGWLICIPNKTILISCICRPAKTK